MECQKGTKKRRNSSMRENEKTRKRENGQVHHFLLFCFLFVFVGNIEAQVTVGAERMGEYLPMLKKKKVALLINQTSLVNKTSLADTLLSLKVKVKKIFAPEHGFRGNQSAGETVADYIDKKTGLPVISLYGKKKMPSNEDLKDIDILIYDIQDVGVRFYTYISTLHYAMQACADNDK